MSKPIKPEASALATAILKSAEIREHSYNDKAALEALKEAEKSGVGVIHFESFYGVSLRDAAIAGSGIELAEPAYLLLVHSWNNAINWAKETLK